MRVVLASSLFSEDVQREHPLLLFGIFNASMQREHSVTIPAEEEPLFEAWCAEQTPSQRASVEVVIKRSLQVESRETVDSEVVACGGATDWSASPPQVGPADILSLLYQPLTILVEHEVNDAWFLRAMVFPLEGEKFRRCLESKWIEFGHGGGSDMVSLIEKMKDSQKAHRTFAVFDSDALAPALPSKESDRKVKSCSKAKVKHHRLRRRAIENYLPPDELDRVHSRLRASTETRAALDAFRELSPAQRAHFNLKAGFSGDKRRLARQQIPEVEALFAGLDPSARKALQNGFGEDVGRHFRDGISEAARRRDGQAEEMEPLFRAILRWL